jgi:hypothetical protein
MSRLGREDSECASLSLLTLDLDLCAMRLYGSQNKRQA